jgi:hypothetical protein
MNCKRSRSRLDPESLARAIRQNLEDPIVSNTVPEEPSHPLLHVHVCIHCASIFRREEVEGRAHATGLFLCTKCGREGPLNIEIRDMPDDGKISRFATD